MLFFLTGNVQIGKTRWLLRALEEWERAGVPACGVVAPGIWQPVDDGFEKLGIDNLLLPERRTVPFARRRDLAAAEGSYDESSQAARADLAWAISDDAIAEVNRHFDRLAQMADEGPRLLVVDELGRLELLRNQGLTSALDLLDKGASPVFPHALVIVRAQLLDTAESRFADADWGGMRAIAPDEEALKLVLGQFGPMRP